MNTEATVLRSSTRLRSTERAKRSKSRINVYIHPEDAEVWERAIRFAAELHVSVSSVVATALDEYLVREAL